MMSGQVEHFGFQALSANKKVNSITHIFLKTRSWCPARWSRCSLRSPSLPCPQI